MRRLLLTRETARQITPAALASVHGGGEPPTSAVPTTSHATTGTKTPTTSKIAAPSVSHP